MKILVVGLGLIGGSYCKALTSYTNNEVYGYDTDLNAVNDAKNAGCIIDSLNEEQFNSVNLIIVCLHPYASENFMKKIIPNLNKGTIITDVCGIKEQLVHTFTEFAADYGVKYVGTHPMAGKENSGFEFSDGALFIGANFIVTPVEKTDKDAVLAIEKLSKEIGFGKIVETSPADHDCIIAYTSQLAHIVSSSYVKSPTINKEFGYSAGSFKDMTRIATLNESMWTSLFMLNKKCLLYEIDELIAHITEYRNAIAENDDALLENLLKNGRLIKENNIKNRTKEKE